MAGFEHNHPLNMDASKWLESEVSRLNGRLQTATKRSIKGVFLLHFQRIPLQQGDRPLPSSSKNGGDADSRERYYGWACPHTRYLR